MEFTEFGRAESPFVLVQPFDRRSMDGIEKEIYEIRRLVDTDFRFIAVTVDDWNNDLSPWSAPAVYGKEDFAGEAADTLQGILGYLKEDDSKYYIGGYSLAGLFALWAAYQTDVFSGVAAASASVWYPDFTQYMSGHEIHAHSVYLSLGDAEPRTRHPVMSTVGERMEQAHDLLIARGVECTYELNPGNHFAEPDVRMAKAFARLLSKDVPRTL